jgi:hypothetical protein
MSRSYQATLSAHEARVCLTIINSDPQIVRDNLHFLGERERYGDDRKSRSPRERWNSMICD